MENSILSSTNLVGTDVKNNLGENLGTIKDVVIDMSSGKVAYLVIAFGGLLGLGDKYFAVPLEAFEVDVQDEKMILNADKEKLENAPGFDKDSWPTHPQRDFVDEVHSFYGYGSYLKDRVKETADIQDGDTYFRESNANLNRNIRSSDGAFTPNLRENPADSATRNRDFDPDHNQSTF